MAAMLDARMVKAKWVWQVLKGKLISLNMRDTSNRIEILEAYIRSVLLYGCSVWEVTKLDGRGRVGVDCTGELETFYRLCLRSILNVIHTTRNSILYILSRNPPFSVYITKTIIQFVESWSKGNWLVPKVARYALKLDFVKGPNQLTVMAMKLTAETFDDRGQLYRNVCHWV